MRNILVVDDDPVIRRELCGFLEEYSRETGEALVACEAENGQKAIEAVCARPIELIFSDIKMPLCTGTQMMEKLRELGYAGQVVIISGFEDYSLIRSSMKLGASDYLLKPIAQEEFRVVLRECLDRPGRETARRSAPPSLSEEIYRDQHAVDLLTAGSPDGAPLLPSGSAIACIADLFRERVPDENRRRAAFIQMRAAVHEPFPYEGLMKQLVSAVCACDFIGFSGFLSQLFSTLCRDRPDLEETRRLLTSILYRAMAQNNHLIAVVGQYKFTEHDLLPCIEEATSAMELRRRMMESFHLYMEALREKTVNRDSYNVSKVKQLLEEEYMKDISLTEISDRLGIHPNYLSTLFKTETGTTYSQYLRALRVKKAADLMRTTNLKVYEIAERVGYSDTASFYRVFKEELGVSPARYKRNLPN